jgi:hypothetical protein
VIVTRNHDFPPMRIAIFSEVYWPMVSGVSLVLQRLVGALEARGHVVRVYTAAYQLPESVSRALEAALPLPRRAVGFSGLGGHP